MPNFYNVEFDNALLLGTAQYPSPAILTDAIRHSQVQIVTASLRREAGGSGAGQNFWDMIKKFVYKNYIRLVKILYNITFKSVIIIL